MRITKTLLHMVLLLGALTTFASCTAQNSKPLENTFTPFGMMAAGEKVSTLGKNIDCIFQDRVGNYWFASSGEGVFRYDGKTLRNITEEKSLVNPEFLKGHFNDKPGSLARVWALNEDSEGNLLIGTIDAGLWKYDGKNLVNFTAKYGIIGDAIRVIYKDHAGMLWIVVNEADVYRFEGKQFEKMIF